MKKMKYGMLVLFLFLINCAVSRESMKADIQGYELPKKPNSESVLIYVVRPSSLGTLIRFNVFLDDQNDSSEMGYTRGNEHIYFYSKPGSFKVYSKAENWEEIPVNAKAGETVFIVQTAEMGLIMARNSLKIADELEGTYHVKNTKLGTVIKEKKDAVQKDKMNQS